MRYGCRDMKRNKIFCHSGLFFALLIHYGLRKSKFFKNEINSWRYYHFTNVYHKWQSYWCMVPHIWNATDIIFCHFRLFFALLPPLTTQKNQNFEKMKTSPGDIIILHRCTINGNHMMYGSWDMKHDKQNFLSFWTILFPFTPLTTWKIKILKNLNKCLEISSFYTGVSKIMIICYTVS